MKTPPGTIASRLLWLVFFTFARSFFTAPRLKHCLFPLMILFMSQTASRADVSLSLQIWHGYDFYYPSVDLTASSPDPVTYDRVESPNGIIWKNFGTNNDSNPFYLTNDLNAILNECNGSWKLYVNKGSGSEQLYHFTVSITGVTTNLFGNVVVLSPADGSTGVTNQPIFYWTGPTNLSFVNVNAYHENGGNSYSDSLPGTATNWTPSGVLTPGDNDFFVEYYSNNLAGFIFTAPTNSSGTLGGWTAEGDVFSYIFSFFSVMTNSSGGGMGGHALVAHYTFDTTNSNPFDLGLDSSPNDNNLTSYTDWGPVHTNATDAVAGRAIQFFGTSHLDANDQVLTNLNDVLAGSFTFSVWVKTTVTNGFDYNNAFFGAVIFWAYNDAGNTNDTIPLSITGGKAAFTTRDHLGNDSTLHSNTSVNDGNYHLITVTRNQITGEKKIYVDGNFETSEIGTTDPLNGNNYDLNIGGFPYILETTSTITNYSSYKGLLDDVQIYTGVLSAAEVAAQFANPGTTIPDVMGGGSGGLVVHYDFDEGTTLAADISGNGNDITVAGNFYGEDPQIDSDSIAGDGSVSFDGGSFLTASSNLLPTLAGTFSLSLWVKTTDDSSSQGDVAWDGACIVSADVPDSLVNGDIIPVALTGGQVAFNTGSPDYGDNTINSSALVNNGQWHHIVVMRNQPTGEKDIYIDGVLDTSGFDTTNLLNDPKILTIGSKADASNPNPSSPDESGSNGYTGLVDDIQIYNRVLSSDEVAFLYNNPGAVIAGVDFAAALNTTNVTWTTDGDLPWFTESSVTHDGLAAQSGPITASQSSSLQTTATANGKIAFNWKVSSEEGYDYLTFYINGNEQAAISGEVDWNQKVYNVSAGDVLRWEYSKDDSDSDGQDAGWLDQVIFAPIDTNPVSADITLNIYREQDPASGDIYIAFPSFDSVTPAGSGTTTNSIESPSGWFNGSANQGGSGSGSVILSSLSQLINECTNGLWTLYINKGLPSERQFHFSVSISGLTTNLLTAVKIITPTNGTTGVLPNTSFKWTGPTNFSAVSVTKQKADNTEYVNVQLPANATNWPSPPVLTAGTNRFDISYDSNSFPNLTFTIPVDTNDLQTVSSWVTHVNLHSTAYSLFVVNAGPLPAALLNPQKNGANFQFQFLSQSGFNHNILYRTNLATGIWLTNSTISGDGTVKSISLPFSLFSPAKQGFIRVSTQ